MKDKDYKDYERTIQNLRNVTVRYKEETKPDNVDKYELEFSVNNSDWSVYSTRLFFRNYKGYYGRSSCSTFVQLGDEELVTHALIKWLNENYQTVFNGMADILEHESERARKKEIEELKARLAEIKGGIDD